MPQRIGNASSLPHVLQGGSRLLTVLHPRQRTFLSSTAVVLLAAALVRAVVLWRWSGNLAADPDLYLEIAKNLSAGEGFARDTGLTAYRPPLYPFVLAAILTAGGGTLAIGMMQLAAGVLTVWLTFRCARHLGLREGAIVAGGIVAIDPLLLHGTTLVMTESLATMLAALILWSGARPMASTTRGAFLTGIVCGLATLCRPTFGAFVALWWLGAMVQKVWQGREPSGGAHRHGMGNLWRKTATAHLVVLGCALPMLPWAIRNQLVLGQPVVLTTHGGYTLLLGHNPVYYDRVVRQPWGTVWDGNSLVAWQALLDEEFAWHQRGVARREQQPPHEEIARDNWLRERAWRYIIDDPWMAVRAGFTLLGRFWNVIPLGEQARQFPGVVRWAMGGFYGLLFVAAAIGIIQSARSEDRFRWWMAGAIVLSFTMVHSLYWADMRMRAPLTPAIALFAARGLSSRARPHDTRLG